MSDPTDAADHERLASVIAQIRASRRLDNPSHDEIDGWQESLDTESGVVSYVAKHLTDEYHALQNKLRGIVITQIDSLKQYESALMEISELIDSDPTPGTPDGDRLSALGGLVVDCERKHCTVQHSSWRLHDRP